MLKFKKFYITTAIDYVNAPPHIGHAFEKIIADSIARYHRLKGEDVFYLTGTDEHGKKIYRTARKRGKSPEDFVEEIVPLFKQLKQLLNLSFDDFIRTEDKQRHYPTAQDIWKRLEKNGDIYKKKYRGMYCVGCESFKTEKELVDGKCPEHNKKPEIVEEENYFFRLSKYANKVGELIEKGELKIIPDIRKNEILGMIKQGINDISFSREKESVPWGILVPGDDSQVMYVWCDALTNYLSGIGYSTDKKMFNKYWPADIHVIGKGINKFHSLFWPAILLSAGIELPKKILVHGYINIDGKKMSKSLGNVVDPKQEAEEFGAEPYRYALIRHIPTTEDGNYSRRLLIEKLNNELADNLGNFVNRVLKFSKKNFGRIPKPKKIKKYNVFEETKKLINEIEEHMEKDFQLHQAIKKVMQISSLGNQYFQEQEPWVTIKINKEKCKETLFVCGNIVKSLAIVLEPFLPKTSEKIWNMLGLKQKKKWGEAKKIGLKSTEIKKVENLFKKVEI